MFLTTTGNTWRREYYQLLQDIFILRPIVENGEQLFTPELYSFDTDTGKAEWLSCEDAEIMLEYKQARARELDGMIQENALRHKYRMAA